MWRKLKEVNSRRVAEKNVDPLQAAHGFIMKKGLGG